MKKLIEQILKFGVVGVVCFFIDFIITLVVAKILRSFMDATVAALIGAFFGFTISVIINYILSMKFVFTRKEDMDRKKEFVIFVILSLIGLLINELIIKGAMSLAYANADLLVNLMKAESIQALDGIVTAVAKIIATGIVMIYNFITRKIFLEEKPSHA